MNLIRNLVCLAALVTPALATAQPAQDDPLRHGAAYGAAIGAAATTALANQLVRWCRTGCEADGSMMMAVLPGAAIGALVGWIADKDAGPTRRVGQRFHARLGSTVMQTWYDSPGIEGTYSAGGVAATMQPSPHVTFAIEYRRADVELRPAPGVVPQHILDNVIPAPNRSAGWTRAPYSRRLGGTLTELVGGRLPAFGPVSVELVGGVSVQQAENLDYFDAEPGQNAARGTYKVLNFQTPSVGYVYGTNVEIAAWRHLVVVPALRVTQTSGARQLSAGAGLQWRF
jgi:hypothetical protein